MSGVLALDVVAASDLAAFLTDSGAIAGGGAALGGTVGYVAASLLQALGAKVDRKRWTEDGVGLGGLFGLCLVVYDAAGVS